MKRLALPFLLAAVAFAIVFVGHSAEAQKLINGRLRMGDSATNVRINGNLEVNAPVFPGDTALGMTIDAGSSTGIGLTVLGQIALGGPFKCGADVACGTVALSSGTPSTATKTVASGSTCVCWPVGTTAAIAAGGCAANVSSTTATFTGPNSVTTTVAWMCFK